MSHPTVRNRGADLDIYWMKMHTCIRIAFCQIWTSVMEPYLGVHRVYAFFIHTNFSAYAYRTFCATHTKVIRLSNYINFFTFFYWATYYMESDTDYRNQSVGGLLIVSLYFYFINMSSMFIFKKWVVLLHQRCWVEYW